ncbi:MAG: hypothetical protein ACLQGP_23810 [Isosphaeraceae bacterium]
MPARFARFAPGAMTWTRPGPALSAACLIALVAACYGGVLFGGRQFAFRDSAHFYYPLYWRVQQEWSAGRLPLWEPGENGGTPMLGSPMAAVLYPGKILFAIVPYDWGVRLYTVGHEVLAFWAMLALMRSWGVSWTGATLAGMSYAFGGVVLSDYFNIIYLVGAAWLPLGFRAADGWIRIGRTSAMAELALVLAMQVLGGDPEVAYLTMISAAGYALALSRPGDGPPARPSFWAAGLASVAVGWIWAGPALVPRIYGSGGPTGPLLVASAWVLGIVAYLASRRRMHRVRLATMLLGLTIAVALALLLAAVQVVPVIEHIASSLRWAAARPDDLYDSSLLPYRVVEWIWPNVFGTFTAGNHYWMPILPPAGAARPSPLSLYAGAMTFVLALGASRFRGGPPWRTWMTAVALLSLWASLGEFAGPARWSVAEPSPTAGDDSFYGFLATSLPALRLFRFPFKVLVFTALSLSALAGAGWDRVAAGVGRRRTLAIGIGLLAVTTIGLLGVASQRDRLVAAIAARQFTHAVFGPLDPTGAVGELLRGLAHGAIALTLSFVVLAGSARRPRPAGLAAVALLAADLALANAPLVIAIPHEDFNKEPAVLRAIREAERADPSPGPFRIQRLPSWVPIGWSSLESPRRLRDLVDWEIDTLQPGFGLMHGLGYVFADESNTGRSEYRRLFRPAFVAADPQTAATLGIEPGRWVLQHPRALFDLWGCRYFIIPAYPGNWTRDNRSYAAFLDQTELIYPDTAAMEDPARIPDRQEWLLYKDVQVRRNRRAFPRAWVVHEARIIHNGMLLHSSNEPEPAPRDTLIARLRSADPSSDDLRTTAYVETDDPRGLRLPLDAGRSGPADATDSLTVRYETPTRAVIEARLGRPGIVVLADAFDPGWRLTIDGTPAPVLRANLLMRAAAVPAGRHTLVYTYDPPSFRIGACASLGGLIGIVVLALRNRPGITSRVCKHP